MAAQGLTGSRIQAWGNGALVAAGFLALAWLERRRRLRPDTEKKVRREVRNLAIAAVGVMVVRGLELPLAATLTSAVEGRKWGLLKLWDLPWWAEVAAGVLLIDYSMYWWHVMNHRVPGLWRLHLPHHADLDLDASTALRFHAGELLATLPLRAVQILGLGLSPLTFSLWQALFGLSILFHHSKLRLPLETEARLLRFVVTPRMHHIHHSIVERETNSNFSSGLTLWDRLHGTLRLNVAQQDLELGVPAFRSPRDVTLAKVLAMPLANLPEWKLPSGLAPARAEQAGPAGTLVA